MRYLLDTGILIRLPERTDPLHTVVRNAIRTLHEEGHALVSSTQNIAELWSVCTRPTTARGGLGLGVDEARRRVRLLERSTKIVREPGSAYQKWKDFVVSLRVEGRQVHDARLAALMKAYRIGRIVTLNERDFVRYPAIVVLTPQDIVSGKR